MFAKLIHKFHSTNRLWDTWNLWNAWDTFLFEKRCLLFGSFFFRQQVELHLGNQFYQLIQPMMGKKHFIHQPPMDQWQQQLKFAISNLIWWCLDHHCTSSLQTPKQILLSCIKLCIGLPCFHFDPHGLSWLEGFKHQIAKTEESCEHHFDQIKLQVKRTKEASQLLGFHKWSKSWRTTRYFRQGRTKQIPWFSQSSIIHGFKMTVWSRIFY